MLTYIGAFLLSWVAVSFTGYGFYLLLLGQIKKEREMLAVGLACLVVAALCVLLSVTILST